MELRTVRYTNRYFDACLRLMNDTWNFDALFPGLGKPGLINRFFLRDSVAKANDATLIVDEADQVHGYLFGVVRPTAADRARRAFRTIRFLAGVAYHFAVGSLGPRREAVRRFSQLAEMDRALEAQRRSADGYVNLFIVGTSLRGLGWGRRLMNAFEAHCRALGHDRVYLWTDAGCNFGFYDHEGFRRVDEIRSPFLHGYGPDPNGFVYAKPLGGDERAG